MSDKATQAQLDYLSIMRWNGSYHLTKAEAEVAIEKLRTKQQRVGSKKGPRRKPVHRRRGLMS